jgi:hypothetical protein
VFELRNQSPFVARLAPALASDGAEMVMAVVKGTFAIGARDDLPVAPVQVPITLADQYYGEPGESSIKYASDVVPGKRGTDVALVGSAHAPKGETLSLLVTLEAGPLRSRVAVIGDRQWKRSWARGVHASDPRPFSTMPLVYERAFGGQDVSARTAAKPSNWAFEPRNPVGVGLVANLSRADLPSVRLPNLEDPADLIDGPARRPRPVGLGFIAPAWKPRADCAGTYDEVWRRDRFPLLPADFDARFYNCAHPDLTSPQLFRGGEPIRVTNASRQGTLELRVPEVGVLATFYIDGKIIEARCDLDTVVIEPDEGRLMLTWRASARCHRKTKYVTGARIAYRGRLGGS